LDIGFDRKALSDALNISEEWETVAVLPVGYPANDLPSTPKKKFLKLLK
jgi:hypothetical protein